MNLHGSYPASTSSQRQFQFIDIFSFIGCIKRRENAKAREDEDDQLDFSWDSEEPAKASIRERALAVRDQPTLADAAHPQQWPEVVGVAQAFARASGLPDPRLGELGSDSGVRAILRLYAAGFTQIEIERVAAFVPKQAWWRSKALGLSSLSPEVVRRNLSAAMASELSPRLAKVLEDVKKRREAG